MPWLLQELTPAFMHRLVGDEEGWGEFRAAWITALNMWFEGMAEPYQPKEARRGEEDAGALQRLHGRRPQVRGAVPAAASAEARGPEA